MWNPFEEGEDNIKLAEVFLVVLVRIYSVLSVHILLPFKVIYLVEVLCFLQCSKLVHKMSLHFAATSHA